MQNKAKIIDTTNITTEATIDKSPRKLTKPAKIVLLVFAIMLVLGIALSVVGAILSNSLEVNYYDIAIKEDGQEVVIAHFSDLHFPQNYSSKTIIKETKANKPNLIFMTGDIIDDDCTQSQIEKMSEFMIELSAIAPVFAVLGNHELRNNNTSHLIQLYKESNIKLLENDSQVVKIGTLELTVAGLGDNIKYNTSLVSGISTGTNMRPLLLLAHRPRHYQSYVSTANIVVPIATFVGHNHGGQFRIFDKAVFSPEDGFFPQYTSGIYGSDGRYMIVSRGLGNSALPFRMFNKFHLPIVKIKI